MALRSIGAPPLGGEGPRTRIWLRFQNQRDFELSAGVTIVGRGDGCQLVLDDPLISRRHACFVVDDREITLKDLGSTNGVLVNGSRVDELQVLVPGDHITLGQHHAELCWVPASGLERQPQLREGRSSRPSADTVIDRRPSSVPPGARLYPESEPTYQGSVFALLSGVAEKQFELGRGQDAERILKRPLESLLARLEMSGTSAEARDVEEAGLLAVRIARSTGQSHWIDYVFRLFAAVGRLAPTQVIDELYPAVRAAPGVSLTVFREYLEVLRNVQHGFGPAERFLLRRLEGLEGVLAS
ncbi:MAG: FHA domain-containing protein [Deltaproteobacteria bacterium]